MLFSKRASIYHQEIMHTRVIVIQLRSMSQMCWYHSLILDLYRVADTLYFIYSYDSATGNITLKHNTICLSYSKTQWSWKKKWNFWIHCLHRYKILKWSYLKDTASFYSRLIFKTRNKMKCWKKSYKRPDIRFFY